MRGFKLYQSHKRVLGKPMTRGEYNIRNSRAVPGDPNDPGYLVQYPDSDNYQSWSPKKQFDEGNTEVIA